MGKTVDLYYCEYNIKLKAKGKKVKIKVKPEASKPEARSKRTAVGATGTDSQGRSTDPYGDGGAWLS